MKDQYEVTIGIPVYNAEKYLRQTLDSALAQTFESIEFLILDDCGTDSSMDIVNEYQCTHQRGGAIRIVRQPQNKGIGEARNRIIDEARGRYLFFLDADDTITPDAIALLYEQVEQHQAQLVYGSYQRIELYGESKTEVHSYDYRVFSHKDEFATFVYRKYAAIQATTWNFLIELSVLRENHLRFQALNYWEDFMFTFGLPTYIERAVLLPNVTYNYYCRPGTLSHFQERSHIEKSEIVSTLNAIEELKGDSNRLHDKPYYTSWLNKVMMTAFYSFCSILRNEKVISPSFTKRELRDIMKSPLTMGEMISLRPVSMSNIVLCAFGVLPSGMSVPIMALIGKLRGLV